MARPRFFSGTPGIVMAGLAMGVLGVLLSVWGNPRNSGICVSCFMENVAGALGLHGDERMKYLRPELAGFIGGAFLLALLRREFRPRGGKSSFLGFVLGFFLIVGSAVFIGCPIKMVLRLAAGDLNALVGAAGLAAGIGVGIRYLKAGFVPGRQQDQPAVLGYVVPFLGVLLVPLLLLRPSFVTLSVSGPGAMHPSWLVALGAGLVIGALAQPSRFCVTGNLRNLLLTRDVGAGLGLLAFLAAAFVTGIFTGQFHPGMLDQPGAHPDHLWNFLGLALVGFAAVLIEGCPFRQLVLAAEGDLDAGLAIMGMLLGGGAVYAWDLRSTADGPTLGGKIAVLAGLGICFLAANAGRRRAGGQLPGGSVV